MKRKTHNRIIDILLPFIEKRIVSAINKSIDTPKPWMPAFDPALGRFPGLSYRGHRKYGHDLLTAILLALLKGGPSAVPVGLLHLVGDASRDQIVKRVGEDGANLIEDMFNFAYGRRLSKKRKSPKKSKRNPK